MPVHGGQGEERGMWDGAGGDEPGRLIAGRYRLLERIGRGGMGTVWQAEDEVLGRHVAIKKLHLPPRLEDADRATLFERTRREARSAARIAHPNVVVVHDVVDDEGLPCIIMEHVRAPALDEVLKKDGPLPVGEAARIGAGMVAALRAAHAAGVLHRDVKPGNVLLGPDGRVVLTDFGIAVVADTSTLTRTGELVGSLDFCAPERLRGGDPGPASDLWALGATLYQAVCGQPPFRRNALFETAYAIAFDPLEPPVEAKALTPLIEELLAKEPADRPSAPEVERRLRQVAVADATLVEEVRLVSPERRGGTSAVSPPVVPAVSSAVGPAVDPAMDPVVSAADGADVPGAGAGADTRAAAGVGPGPGPTPGPAPGPAPGGDLGRGRGPGRGRRIGVWVAVAVVVVALALGGVYFGLRVKGEDSPAAPPASPQGDKPSAGGKRSPKPGPRAVPDGYRLVHEKKFGVSFPVPDGWTRKELDEESEGVAYIDPTGKVSLRVSALDFASNDPLQRWKDDEAASIREGKLPGYRQIRMQNTTYRGMPAAIWEFTWQGRARQFRAQDLGFGKPGEKEYAMYLSAPSTDWERHKDVFVRVREGFRLGSDAQ
ncbi:protein kinase domain-containing protein [Streptomyces iconiensis]|uniref:non-specific serine/threonine protein kinase n=1 Tax=Streptomyces iconiensis TaxID=1384038 RepID=A0ABT6ZSR6_9ACTN|nr:serine/threonine-protein kinase [Streptomyces iconiensis]MDJ1131503.1 serine/threonine-protein kinase [Streptomyces iconiensis]